MDHTSLAFQHLNEAVYLISLTSVATIFYTFIFILYCLSIRLCYAELWDEHGKIKRQTAWTLVLQTTLLICATLDIIVENRTAQVRYIDYRILPEGPFSLPAELSTETLAKISDVVNIIENLLILGVLLWRVWVIWSGTRLVIPFTIISSLYLGNAGFGISYNVITWNTDSMSLRTTPRVQSVVLTMASVFSVGSLFFMTLAIIARVLFIRRKHIKLMGRSDVASQYLGIATMLIESYSLDALWAIASLISLDVKYAPVYNLFNDCVILVDILSEFLLIYRVLSGRAWTRQTQNQLSGLKWASNGAGTTTSGTVDLPQTKFLAEDPPAIGLRNCV